MHPNPAFRKETAARNLEFARQRGFGVLCLNGPEGPLLAHVPFLLNKAGSEADLHLLRSNPIARIGAGEAVIAISGPDGYTSPDWYKAADQVPTWNYIAVHLRGQLTPLADEALRDLLDRQSAHFEGLLAPKSPWSAGKMTPEVLERMMRMIQPFRLTIEDIQGTWKLNQNKPEGARLGAASMVNESIGQDLGELARHMRKTSG